MKKLLILALMALSAFAQGTVTLTGLSPAPVNGLGSGVVGTAGTATACYWVVVNYVGGGVMSAAPTCPVNIPNTLSGSNYVLLTWQPTGGTSITYDVLKTTTNTPPLPGATVSITTGLTSPTYQDQGGSLSPYTIAPFPYSTASALVRLNNLDYTLPTFEYVSGGPIQGAFGVELPKGGSTGVLRLGSRSTPVTIDATGAPYITNGSSAPGAGVGTTTAGILIAASGNLTLAQVNAGTVVVPAVTGQTLKVHHAVLQALGGATATCTAVEFADTAASPIVIMSVVIAGLGQNVWASEASAANSTKTTMAPLTITASKGIQILQTGSACATATSFNWILFYTINS